MIIWAQPSTVRRMYCNMECEIGEKRSSNPTYSPELFRHRFYMQKSFFLHIVDVVTTNDEFFSTKAAQVEMVIHHCIIKYTRAMNEGVCLWNINRYRWWILTNWCNGNERWCHLFRRRCHFLLRWHILRRPNKHDLTKLLYVVEQRGFPSMICRIDCMDWKCKVFYCLG